MDHKKRILQIALVVVGSVHLFSCGGAANLPSNTNVDPGAGACPAGIGGMSASCCDSSGVVISPPVSSICPVAVPGSPGITAPLSAGSASAGASSGENDTAASLIGGQEVGSGLANESAATAGGISPSVSGAGGSIPLQTSGLGVTSSGNAGGGGNNGTGSGDASGSVATAPASVPSSTSADPNSLANGASAVTSAQYAGGGAGGGVLPNGAKATGFQFGNGFANGDGAAGANAAEIGFGAQRNPAAMAGEDPSDYFTRINLDDSLFKKVEKRYRATSANWEMASVAPQAQVKVRK